MKGFFQKRFALPAWLLLTGMILVLSVEISQHASRHDDSARITGAESSLKQLCGRVQESIAKIAGFSSEKEFHDFFIHSGLEQAGISFYILENGQIVRWSDNEPVLDASAGDSLENGKMIRLANGWFLPFFRTTGKGRIIGLVLVKHEYAYENKYLRNEFNPALGLSAFVPAGQQGTSFLAPDGSALFRLKRADTDQLSESRIPGMLYLVVYLLLLLASYLTGRMLFQSSWRKGAMFMLFLGLLRTSMVYLHIPDEWYSAEWFSPKYYASSFLFNSPGDLLLNVLLFLTLCFLLYRVVPKRKPGSPVSPAIKWTLLVAFAALLAAVHTLISGLVLNSRISVDVSDLSALNGYTALAFLCVGLILAGLFLLGSAAARYLFMYTWSYQVVMLVIVGGAAYTSLTFWQLDRKREWENRMLMAQKTDARQDHVAEFLFDDARKKMESDTVLLRLMKRVRATRQPVGPYLTSTYFKGYLGKFDVSVLAFDTSGNSLDTLRTPRPLSSFQDQARDQGRTTYCEQLYYLPGSSGRLSYMAILPLRGPAGQAYGSVVLLLSSKTFQQEEGFPELFIGNKYTENLVPGDYSFARYTGGALVYEYGNYAYSFSDAEFGRGGPEYQQLSLGGYNHLIYRPDAAATIVVSRPEPGRIYLLTFFSWVFAFFSLLAFVLYTSHRFIQGRFSFRFNLQQRIQVSVLLLVVLSFILILSGTVIYIFRKYDTDEKRSISEQVNGLWFLLGSNVGTQEKLSAITPDALLPDLNRLVNNLNIDFNLFDDRGQLYFSSQPKIFEQGIVSGRMNPEALFELNEFGHTQFIHPENVGTLKYIAAYAPLTDRNGAITGYLHLPYFEKQNELNREISGFLSALINIYVLLLALAVLVTLFIASRITKPLILIQEKLAGLRLGKRNEQIEYTRQDEIGQLVKEYNRMVDELTFSAGKLAQSERESAWREMAKQVAHEIKNPLTPMRLSIQHLQQALKENREGKQELVERISATLIQQIDTLSGIATEFSNFALMPKAKTELVSLNEVVGTTVRLFSESPGIELSFEEYTGNDFVIADKDQLIRVFSNLLKNAVQSVPDSSPGKIDVRIEADIPGFLRVSVSDNGIGIPEDQRDKIFTPNFTTKSSGMGLGLAMVKNIVENVNGKVWFSSLYGNGTTFFVSLPKAI